MLSKAKESFEATLYPTTVIQKSKSLILNSNNLSDETLASAEKSRKLASTYPNYRTFFDVKGECISEIMTLLRHPTLPITLDNIFYA